MTIEEYTADEIYKKKLNDYAVKVLQRIVTLDDGYDDSDLRDCMTVLFGK